jgi:hypothetical protein
VKELVSVLPICLILCLGGCSQTPFIIGKWKISNSSITEDEAKATFEFKSDKSYVMSSPTNGYDMKIKGDYTVSGTKIILRSTNAEFSKGGTSMGVGSGSKEAAVEDRPFFTFRTIDSNNIELTDQLGNVTQLRRIE